MEGAEIEGGSNRRLNRFVAMTVVMLSIAMALTKIKDDNIVQAMQADKAASVDTWSEYQAARVKLHITQGLDALHPGGDPTAANKIAKYQSESQALKVKAEGFEADY